MANFTFDDDDKAGNTGNEANGANGREPGSSNGEGSSENTDSGPESDSDGTTGEASNPFPGATSEAPYGYTAAGTIRKRRPRGYWKYTGEQPPNSQAGTGSSDKSRKERLDIRNDREKVKANIAGLHAMAAVLTKQPILNLNDKECNALTIALCDVADYHNFDLIGAGGAFGLYASLASVAYMIYVPRFLQIKYNKAADNARPVTPGEAGEQASTRAGRMDFTADVVH